MIKRLLFNRVDTKARRPAIGRQNNFTIDTTPDKAQPPLSIAHLAKTWAQVTLHPAIFQPVPVTARFAASQGWVCFHIIHK